MAKKLDGRKAATAKKKELKRKVQALREKGIEPNLAIIRIGNRPDDIAYENSAIRHAKSIGIKTEKHVLQTDATQQALLAVIRMLNKDDFVHGILLMRPLPGHIMEEEVVEAIDPAKDTDGLTDISAAGVFEGMDKGYPPCTSSACLALLEHYGIEIEGKRVVIIGRSMVAGRPLAMQFLNADATVTICHTKTAEEDILKFCHEADIICVATGRKNTLMLEHTRPGQTIIDVGIHIDRKGHIYGDVDYDRIEPVVGAISPVPGGVGSVTTTMLMEHILKAAEKSIEQEL